MCIPLPDGVGRAFQKIPIDAQSFYLRINGLQSAVSALARAWGKDQDGGRTGNRD